VNAASRAISPEAVVLAAKIHGTQLVLRTGLFRSNCALGETLAETSWRGAGRARTRSGGGVSRSVACKP